VSAAAAAGGFAVAEVGAAPGVGVAAVSAVAVAAAVAAPGPNAAGVAAASVAPASDGVCAVVEVGATPVAVAAVDEEGAGGCVEGGRAVWQEGSVGENEPGKSRKVPGWRTGEKAEGAGVE
jgi:hypothetical protein